MLTEASFRRAVAVSVLAPSLHNSQPWLFERQDDRVLVRVDPSRWLRHEDPLHREQVLSCGAAVHHLVVGLRHAGFDVTWEATPTDDPDLVAVVTVLGRRPETWHELHLYTAAAGRHMDRTAFADAPVPAIVLEQLAAVASEQGCSLRRLDHRGVTALAILTDLAEQRFQDDPALRAEQQGWTSDLEHPAEGVPRNALAMDPSDAFPVRLRDFSGSTAGKTAGKAADKPGLGADDHAVIVVLSTETDDRRAWVRCGWALSDVLLNLADQGLVASPLNQPLEVSGLRACLRAACEVDGFPQLALRLGYPSAFGSPRTGRRPVEQVLLEEVLRQP